jgi:hypothetical protein
MPTTMQEKGHVEKGCDFKVLLMLACWISFSTLHSRHLDMSLDFNRKIGPCMNAGRMEYVKEVF